MEIKENIDLQSLNTFRVASVARYFCVIKTVEDLLDLMNSEIYQNNKHFILGKGANILFRDKEYNGFIIKNELKGIKTIGEDNKFVTLEIGSGEDWHSLVNYTVDKGWGGIENLAYIPSTVGGAVANNIAAYGQNLKDVALKVNVLDLETREICSIENTDCEFDYHTSAFKTKYKKKYFIVSVTIKLLLKPNIESSYSSRNSNRDSIEGELAEIAKKPYTVRDVFNAVVNIRKRKLPDPEKEGTVGSVFLNPYVNKHQLEFIQTIIPDIQFYPATAEVKYLNDEKELVEEQEWFKVPAGWMLDHLGWTGKRIGNCYTPPKQALCVCSNGKATADEILGFMKMMEVDFKKTYNIKLENEVELVS